MPSRRSTHRRPFTIRSWRFVPVTTALSLNALRTQSLTCSLCNGIRLPRCSHSQQPIPHSRSSFLGTSTQQPLRRLCVESPSTLSGFAQTAPNPSAPSCVKPPRLFSDEATHPHRIPTDSSSDNNGGLLKKDRNQNLLSRNGFITQQNLSITKTSRLGKFQENLAFDAFEHRLSLSDDNGIHEDLVFIDQSMLRQL